MNNNNLQQIISTVLITVFGLIGLNAISPKNSNALELQTASIQETTKSQTIASTSTNPIQEFSTTKIYKHKIKNQDALTVYFQGLPLLTFLDTSSPKVNDIENLSNNFESKAQQFALRLDRLILEQADANQITVSWKQTTKSYSIKYGQEELIIIDNNTILPDRTKNLEHDALQATNRLRRFLGNAQPLSEVSGKPKLKPKLTAYNRNLNSNYNSPFLNSPLNPNPPIPIPAVKSYRRGYQGVASWYGPGFHGRQTASGERFNQNALTAAHPHLPFGTQVLVTNLNNGRSVVVRINDRGPHIRGRIIDLSKGAAKVIGVFNNGTASVRLEILGR